MKFPALNSHLTGAAVPVAALRSRESCGVGEFLDLPLFGRWCRAAGLSLIQILPVNDTGTNSSPYSSLSAFALHPLYIRLQAVPGVETHLARILEFRGHAEERKRFSYPDVLAFKHQILEQVFARMERDIRGDGGFAAWREANPWVIPYAVFKARKSQTNEAPWASWGAGEPDAGALARMWADHEPSCLFHAWVQHLLERQLTEASHSLQAMGIRLKGDIPILMSEESADVWSRPRFFDLSMKAGAPPDMYCADGQNWGFPTYNWDAMAEDGYTWWKGRLTQAAKFFHAFRIDHVLGFFRIWRIPRTERRGLLGGFSPSLGMTRGALAAAGFDAGRVRWLSVPHARTAEMDARLGGAAARIRERCFDRIGTEEMFTLKPEMDSEEAILALGEPAVVTEYLMARHQDRALIPRGPDCFDPAWYFWQAASFKSLGEEEQARLRQLITGLRGKSEELWEERGRRLLTVMRDATDMLVCAEDLGDVPDCVPRVLAELGILGLRIVRWAREYKTPGAPFIAPADYPALTVATASVHDTSTLRGWWEEDGGEREAYFRHLGGEGECPPRMQGALLTRMVTHLMEASSLLCVLQLQDLLDLDPAGWSADPADDRVNVPGTVNPVNWTWRMPLTTEELMERDEPRQTILRLAQARAGMAAAAQAAHEGQPVSAAPRARKAGRSTKPGPSGKRGRP
jgi:4-alpha-glucanotransferase